MAHKSQTQRLATALSSDLGVSYAKVYAAIKKADVNDRHIQDVDTTQTPEPSYITGPFDFALSKGEYNDLLAGKTFSVLSTNRNKDGRALWEVSIGPNGLIHFSSAQLALINKGLTVSVNASIEDGPDLYHFTADWVDFSLITVYDDVAAIEAARLRGDLDSETALTLIQGLLYDETPQVTYVWKDVILSGGQPTEPWTYEGATPHEVPTFQTVEDAYAWRKALVDKLQSEIDNFELFRKTSNWTTAEEHAQNQQRVIEVTYAGALALYRVDQFDTTRVSLDSWLSKEPVNGSSKPKPAKKVMVGDRPWVPVGRRSGCEVAYAGSKRDRLQGLLGQLIDSAFMGIPPELSQEDEKFLESIEYIQGGGAPTRVVFTDGEAVDVDVIARGSELHDTLLSDVYGKAKHYVLAVEGGINAELTGPFTSQAERDRVGTSVHDAQDPETDATFAVDVDYQGNLTIDNSAFNSEAD